MDQLLLARIVFAVLLIVAGVWLLMVAYLARSGGLERRRVYGRLARAEMFSDDAWYEAQVVFSPWIGGAGYAALFGGVGIAVGAQTRMAVNAITFGSIVVTVVACIVGVSVASRAARQVVRGQR